MRVCMYLHWYAYRIWLQREFQCSKLFKRFTFIITSMKNFVFRQFEKVSHTLNVESKAVTIDKVLSYVNQVVAPKAFKFRHTHLNQPSLNQTTGC